MNRDCLSIITPRFAGDNLLAELVVHFCIEQVKIGLRLTFCAVRYIIRLRFGDGTHNKKRQANIARGKIPIEKNITVMDENGTQYESTWLKRANGLVKKGRARWLNEHTICLARPLKTTEESNMDSITDPAKLLAEGVSAEAESAEITLNDLLRHIDDIHREMGYLHKLVANWKGGEAIGIGNVVEEREKTYRQMLSFLERIYSDRFAPVSEKEKMDEKNAILLRMNEAIAMSLSSSAKDSGGAIDAIMRFYGGLLDKI
jgi:hypothetical protein